MRNGVEKWLAILRPSVFRYVCCLLTHIFLMLHAINFMFYCIFLEATLFIFIYTTINSPVWVFEFVHA